MGLVAKQVSSQRVKVTYEIKTARAKLLKMQLRPNMTSFRRRLERGGGHALVGPDVDISGKRFRLFKLSQALCIQGLQPPVISSGSS